MKRLCLICGRGGSKRLPGKNIMPFGGKALIAHSIEQAIATGLFANIGTSSDDDTILDAAAKHGADIIIKRPVELATDEASSLPMIQHAIAEAEKQSGISYDSIVYLQITSPLRLPQDIQKAVEIFEQNKSFSLLSVVKRKNLNIKGGDDFGKDEFHINGSIYIWDKAEFMKNPRHIYDNTCGMAMLNLRSVDIDTANDFTLAEALLNGGQYKQGESYAIGGL